MILTRKILVPIILLFALIHFGSLFSGYSAYQSAAKEESVRSLSSLKEAFGSELENQENLVLSLAQEIANNPSIQEAFANQDRDALLELTASSFERNKAFGIYQYQFYTPQTTSFLKVHDSANFGDDLSAKKPMVVLTNSNQTPTTGMELNTGGLGVFGVVPVYYKNVHIGSFEVGSNVSSTILSHLEEEYGDEWHILLTQNSVISVIPEDIATMKAGPVENLLLYASTSDTPVYSSEAAYSQALNEEKDVVEQKNINRKNYAILTAPIRDHNGEIIGIFEIVIDNTAAASVQNSRLLISGLIGLAILLGGGGGLTLFVTRTMRPIASLTQYAEEIQSGKTPDILKAQSNDEIGKLTVAFSDMATQLKESISGLEQRVNERTRDLTRRTLELTTVTDVAREIATIRNLDTLLNVAADVIRIRFNFYQVGVFLVDGRGEYAILRAASGPMAQQLLNQKHKLKVGATGIIGNVTRTGQARIAQDVKADPLYFNNPLLVETRSEIGLPLRSRSLTIGALDIQSTEVSAFEELDIQTMQLLADQLSAAIENAQLVEQVEGAISELNKTYRAQTLNIWKTAISERGQSSFEYDGQQIRAVPHHLPEEQIKQLEAGKPVIVKESTEHTDVQNTLLIPLIVLNQVIGVIGLEQEDRRHAWTEEEIAVAEAAANRAALALENARLLEESQRRAAKEHAISEAVARIGSALNVENILYTSAEELERVLGSTEVTLQINTETRSFDNDDRFSGVS